MKRAIVLAIVGLGPSAHANPECAHVLARLGVEVTEAGAHPILLTSSPVDEEGEPCLAPAETAIEDAEPPVVETGKLAGMRAQVRSVHADQLADRRDRQDASRRQLGFWSALDHGAFQLWSTLVIGDSEWQSLALPLVYTVSKQRLVLDRMRTTAEIARFAGLYARAAADPKSRDRDMHATAAAAYAAYVAHVPCPP